jgi:hypothetical protein
MPEMDGFKLCTTGKLSINIEPVNLMELILNNAALNRAIAGRKEITVEYNADNNMPIINLDRKKLSRYSTISFRMPLNIPIQNQAYSLIQSAKTVILLFQ